MLQDTHIHLHDIKIPSEIERYLAAFKSAGFSRLFAAAITPVDWPIIKALADRHPEIIPFYGIHPWFSDMAEKGWQEKLVPYLSSPRSGVGETGLDKSRKNIDFELQKEVFSVHLRAALQIKKPYIVHSVRAWNEAIALIDEHAKGIPFIAHSFAGSKEIMDIIVKMGGYISISVKQFQKPEPSFEELFKVIPVDRLLLETDFPYQVKLTSPEDYISAVRQGYEKAAVLRAMPAEAFEKQIYSNGQLFSEL